MSSENKNSAPERMHYIDGYIPVAYNSPHSSLDRSATWLGMGFLLSALAGVGAVLFAVGANSVGQQQEHWVLYTIIGVVFAVLFLVIGTVLIKIGRAPYHRYVKETGREH
ncbi:hypothetical protein A583_01771 [Corynebacterium glutamicum Z188]|uniref:Uncharacterized protein n=1 Tax=Corynebacterium glutamicum TaxID=1718 RepID=A0AB36I5D6_CORGT|nr:hypothetical protein [Corynebacterium glutamicum]AGN18036.1 hypothetical protein C624_02235 [Corynebacterium glutamicum SCgG1]AGN21059.1 hypothetical protein C629_02235 [Corynebacterium glutamicum SCgG2]EGV40962.1 hypothetical protein CgS9114_05062 [Corynebacterium glutamicum S9114]EPP41778.1 hypothetical protein A583_01771 [Corynebacterium glutamicum Z188]NII88499.1 hypothetical protein [Corynebacterium glutamicum]